MLGAHSNFQIPAQIPRENRQLLGLATNEKHNVTQIHEWVWEHLPVKEDGEKIEVMCRINEGGVSLSEIRLAIADDLPLNLSQVLNIIDANNREAINVLLKDGENLFKILEKNGRVAFLVLRWYVQDTWGFSLAMQDHQLNFDRSIRVFSRIP
jgi:hypothetical protein